MNYGNILTETLLDNPASLKDILEEDSHIADIETNEPSLMQNSPYYSTIDFQNLLENKLGVFNVISLNCQSLNAKFDQLKYYIEMYNNGSHKISAICLQETWLTADSDLSLFHIPGYHLVSEGKSCSAHGGVATYLHESFNHISVSCNSPSNSWDGQFIEIDVQSNCNESKPFVLGNIYRPPRQTSDNINTFIDEFEAVCNQFRNYKHVLLTGDFNINLLKYKENNLINSFLESVMTCGYIPKITLPTRLTHRQGTLIDNFFMKISDEFSSSTSGILVNDISDHLPYFLCLDYLLFKKANDKFIKVDSSFSENIGNLLDDLREPTVSQRFSNITRCNPHESHKNLMSILTPLLQKHFPSRYVRYNKYKHKKCKWMTKGIMKSIAYKDKLYMKLKSLSSSSNNFSAMQTNFKTYSRILRQAIRAAKKEYYHTCFLKFKSDIKKTWATINDIICKTKNKSEFPKYFLINGSKVSDDKSIANEFNKFFTEIGPKLADGIDAPENKSFSDYLKNPSQNKFSFTQVTAQDVAKAIDSLKPKTSCANDKISNKLLKAMRNELSVPLMLIINQSIEMGIFPDLLKTARVTPLYKKGDSSLLDNYRPVSVLPSVSKVFERIMYNQIFKHFTDFNLFYQSQYGFRTGHSTELAALELVDRILKDMDQNKLPINIYMDLSKAFDTLDHQILLDKLKFYGFYDKSLDLLGSYLSNRNQYVEYNSTSSELLGINCGVPQGSILGPLLFIIYINDLPSSVKYFKLIIYADDTTLFASLTNNDMNSTDVNFINEELVTISEWLKLNKLSLNIAKTKAILFHTKQRHVNEPDIFVDGRKIDFVSEFNFLGLMLDKHLTWKAHIHLISKKISKVIGVMARLKNSVPRSAMLHIYNSLVLSYLNYGLIIWGSQSKNLTKLQKKAMRLINNAKYNAHTSILFKQNKILKLIDLCALHDFKFSYKLIHGLLPDYFMLNVSGDVAQGNYVTRQTGHLRIPAVRHDFAKNGISYRYPVIFNTMPPSIKEKVFTHSFFGFKYYIKNSFIESYHTDCNIPHCYVCQNF